MRVDLGDPEGNLAVRLVGETVPLIAVALEVVDYNAAFVLRTYSHESDSLCEVSCLCDVLGCPDGMVR